MSTSPNIMDVLKDRAEKRADRGHFFRRSGVLRWVRQAAPFWARAAVVAVTLLRTPSSPPMWKFSTLR